MSWARSPRCVCSTTKGTARVVVVVDQAPAAPGGDSASFAPPRHFACHARTPTD